MERMDGPPTNETLAWQKKTFLKQTLPHPRFRKNKYGKKKMFANKICDKKHQSNLSACTLALAGGGQQ
jgi:hypothetical protein